MSAITPINKVKIIKFNGVSILFYDNWNNLIESLNISESGMKYDFTLEKVNETKMSIDPNTRKKLTSIIYKYYETKTIYFRYLPTSNKMQISDRSI